MKNLQQSSTIFNNPQFGEIRAVDKDLKGTYLGVVYALEYGDFIKIGSTNSPYNRLWALSHQAKDYGNYKIGRFAFTEGHTNFRENEVIIHKVFKNERKQSSELFEVTLEQVIEEFGKLEYQDDTNKIKKNSEIFLNGMKRFVTGVSPTISFKEEIPTQCNVSVISDVRGYLDENNTIWLNAEDVAKGFGFTTVATSGNDTVRWSRVNKYLKEFGYSQQVSKDCYLPENMVYRLGFKANNTTAQKFQSVLADEVLPAIRKTGGYIATSDGMTDAEIMAKAVLVAQETIEKRNERIKELESENDGQRAVIEANAPKVAFANALVASSTSCLIGELAKLITQNGYAIGQNRLFEWMRTNGYLGTKGERRNVPNQQYIEQGLFEIKKGLRSGNDGVMHTTLTTKVTNKGCMYFVNKFIN